MTPKSKRKKNAKGETVHGKAGVFYKLPQGEGGPIQIRIDFGHVPAPQNYYYADAVILTVDRDLRMAILSFGRRAGKTDKFADRIDIVMPTISLFSYFWSSSRDVEKTVDKLIEAAGITPRLQPMSPADSLAMTLFANMIFMAVGEGESSLDFYHLSPRDVHLAKTRSMDMQVQPTVRVIMSSILTKHFFNLLKPYADQNAALQPIQGKVAHATVAH